MLAPSISATLGQTPRASRAALPHSTQVQAGRRCLISAEKHGCAWTGGFPMAAVMLIPVLTFGCALLAAAGMPAGACAQVSEPQSAGATVAHTVEATAVIEAVDQQRREVLIRG